MKRIVSLLNLPDEFSEKLSSVSIDRIDFFKEKSVIQLVLTGLPTDAEYFNRFLEAVKFAAGCDVTVSFNGVTVDNAAPYFEVLDHYFKQLLSNLRYHYIDDMRFTINNGVLRLIVDDYILAFIDEDTTYVITTTLLAYVNETLNLNLTDYDIIADPNSVSVPAYEPVIPTASGDGEEEYFTPYIPQEILDKQAEIEKKKEEEAKAEQVVDKNSWAFKAQEKQKEAREQSKENGDVNYRKKNADALFGRVQSGVSTFDIKDVTMSERLVNVVGRMSLTDDLKLSKSGKVIIANFIIMDKTGGISAFAFINPKEGDAFEKMFKKGGFAGFQGEPQYNRNEFGLKITGIFEAEKPPKRKDTSDLKRVELHVHSKYSEKDAVSDPASIMKLAASFGHKACAITDHGVVQAFPEAYNAAKGLKVGDTEEPFKSILGCEGYLVDDGPTIVYNLPFINPKYPENNPLIPHVGNLVSISITTTGSDSCSDKITHVAATKYRLKGYKPVKPEMEGESDESAIEFSAKDIDKSLWEPDEIPETLRDENIATKSKAIVDDSCHVINKKFDLIGEYSPDENEVVPEEIIFEHVADFYAEVEDIPYVGKGEPCDSYFRMGELVEFIGDSYICGPDIFNALAFLRRAGYGINIEDHVYYRHKFLMPLISISDILKYSMKEYSSYDAAISELGISSSEDNELLNEAHNAAKFVIKYLQAENETDPSELNDRIGHFKVEDIRSKKNPAYHIIFLARNNLGLYNMYRMISESHTHYFGFRPRTPKSLVKYFSSSVIIGGACERGEIYRFVLETYKQNGKNSDITKSVLYSSPEFKDILSLYEYVEVQPLCNNMFMTREVNKKNDPNFVPINVKDIQVLNELLVDVADHFGMMCVATTDSHFLDKENGMYRKYLLMSEGFSDADTQPDLYFRNTEEMLDEFAYLGEEKAIELVVTNTNLIADKIQYGIKPFPDGTYPPIISRAAADVRDIAFTRANRLYRHNGVLNEVVKARLEKELNSIIGHGFAIMYYIAYRLVKKSNRDGYIVGSRGSVGSSFVATMCGISEVNPLMPHYRCPKCCYVEFDETGTYGSGFDMEPKNCPECGEKMHKDGQDIPFETFLGFNGDKEPDIDLNFSSAYQPRAHKYVEYLFGLTHTFRAGTIGTYADKNAYGVAKSAAETMGLTCTNAQLMFMSEGIIGVKRTTSQHPGGIVVIPKEMDVYEFTPIQFPANKIDESPVTTHFDFHAMHDTILKLDILGHADPTVLRMLQDITDVEVTTIPVPDDKVMSLLESTDALGFPLEATDAGSATLGLSELGTDMARGMIKEAKPRRFYDLVQLMGLSHGTDVWTGNAQDLIRDGICDLNSVIGCRDSIMTSLIYWGLPNFDSFDIMEKVRKGKGLTPEREALMREHNVPNWYIDSCKKIKYMFPKAHAAAYSISTLRVAWFKVYYPEEYYCAFLTIRGDEFSADEMCQGVEKLTARRKLLDDMRHQDKNNPKVKSEYYLCEIVEEMYHRGIEFLPIDLATSHAVNFVKVAPGKILPPLSAIDTISENMAEGITKAREEAPFANREDLMTRGGIGKSAIAKLADYGLLDGMPESAQIDIFSLL